MRAIDSRERVHCWRELEGENPRTAADFEDGKGGEDFRRWEMREVALVAEGTGEKDGGIGVPGEGLGVEAVVSGHFGELIRGVVLIGVVDDEETSRKGSERALAVFQYKGTPPD